jgi:hypothetical protein
LLTWLAFGHALFHMQHLQTATIREIGQTLLKCAELDGYVANRHLLIYESRCGPPTFQRKCSAHLSLFEKGLEAIDMVRYANLASKLLVDEGALSSASSDAESSVTQ